MRRLLGALPFLLVWVVVAIPTWAVLLTHSQSAMVVAGHDTTVRPTLDGYVRLDLGPYVPDARVKSGGRIGVHVVVGKTTAATASELAVRYAAIAAHPVAEQRRVREQVIDLAWVAAMHAGVLALTPIGLWFLLGSTRRRQLTRNRVRFGAAASFGLALVVVLLVQPWHTEADRVQGNVWLDLGDAFPELAVPPELAGWQVQGGLFTEGTRRLVFSLFDTYQISKVFYRDLADSAVEVADQLHPKSKAETVAVLVSDRHDNIGMDAVVRAVADQVGATVVVDAGDDTSMGQPWEGFSLDSLHEAFAKYDARVAVAGNHDNGTFVSRYLEKLGWTHLNGEPEKPFGGVRVTGVDDPRSSGLGNWRDQKGLSFSEVKATIADDVCKLDEDGQRIATLVVHDANLGGTALARGCTDLVVAGHLHEQKGPTRVVGENGKAGYSYTNGTTGGAAYAVAIGSKLRRDAEFTFITYRDGRPVGIQPVNVMTTGAMLVADYIPLDLG